MRGDGLRGGGFRGFKPEPGKGEKLLLTYATGQRAFAEDGVEGQHSPFAKVLLEELKANPNTNFYPLLFRVAGLVGAVTQYRQMPQTVPEGGIPEVCLAGVGCSSTVEDIEGQRQLVRALANTAGNNALAGNVTLTGTVALTGGTNIPLINLATSTSSVIGAATGTTLFVTGVVGAASAAGGLQQGPNPTGGILMLVCGLLGLTAAVVELVGMILCCLAPRECLGRFWIARRAARIRSRMASASSISSGKSRRWTRTTRQPGTSHSSETTR